MNFSKAEYLVSAALYEQCPPDTGVEVAFAGRSNSGKSSTLNVLTNQRNLARTSKTPGRTQLLNFFQLEEDVRLVDLPGFGYAKVPVKVQQAWNRTLDNYFRERESLVGLVLVSDIRHPPRDFESQLLEWCCDIGLPVILLLNKADKLSRNQAASQTLARKRSLAVAGGDVEVLAVSALKRQGFDVFEALLSEWLEAPRNDGQKNPGSTGE